VDELTYRIEPSGAAEVWLHDMVLERADAGAIELEALKQRLEACFMAVMRARAENDGYNALVLEAGLQWRDVALVRTLSRFLRHFVNSVEAALRTNFYQIDQGDQPKPTISVKFESGKIDGLPLPRPLYEIFVYSPRVEAVHLRFGKVARGGIRWSDRPQDFRTEILGLVKAQQVKNAVIVPVGAKGGFVPKQSPKDGTRDAVQAEGTATYTLFISTLLDITDNL